LLHIIGCDETDPKESENVETEEQAGLSVASGRVPRPHDPLFKPRKRNGNIPLRVYTSVNTQNKIALDAHRERIVHPG
jgi:hypothetical protein